MINFLFQEFAAVLFSFSELLHVLLIFFSTIPAGVSPLSSQSIDWKKAIKAYIQRGRFCFFLSDYTTLNMVQIEAFQISPADIFIGVGYGMINLIFLLSYNLSFAFCVTAVLTLWLAVNDFYKQGVSCFESPLHFPKRTNNGPKEHEPACAAHQKCARSQERLFTSLMESYTELKTLATKINESLGGVFLGGTVTTTFFFALNLSEIFGEIRWEYKLVVYYFIVKMSLFFALSGDICHKVKLNFNL